MMTYCFSFFILLIWLTHSFVVCYVDIHPTCYPVKAPLCTETLDIILLDTTQTTDIFNQSSLAPTHRKSKWERGEDGILLWRYNTTTYPTFANEKSEADVITSFSRLHPLLSTKCSKFIKVFLCSVHSPVCTSKGLVPPCRELCETVKHDCQEISEIFDIEWPEILNCGHFPSQTRLQSKDIMKDYLRQGENTFLISRHESLLWEEALLDEGNVCIPPNEEDVVLPALWRLNQDRVRDNRTSLNDSFDFGVSCPSELRAPPGHFGYTFMGLPNCTAPCPNMYLESDELALIRVFICVLAVICLVVTSFTLLTFAIDRKRFRYPERPIVFYALSYLMISITFLLGFILGEKAACNEKIVDENNEVVQGFAVVEGSSNRLCSVILLILYYFTVSGTIWWVILTVTWLLAAGFSWGSEAIEERRLYYHAVAWGLPALQTLIVFISNKTEGDNIAGVCFVGLYDVQALRYLVLLPMCVYLVIGTANLFTGFFYLNRVRKKLGEDQENKEKLAKFMLRIGVFSVLYILPQVILVAIYAIEDSHRAHWEASWYAETCDYYSVPCPASSHPVGVMVVGSQHPGLLLFCIKYAVILIVALPPLFWVASKKTMHSWWNFMTRKEVYKNSNLNTTQTPLLNDSNGPHARDRQANLEARHNDEVFGNICNTDLHGSSASVAARLTTKRPVDARQRQWEDLTDSESTDNYSTSMDDSELSRVLASEAQKNDGIRVVGRKGRKLYEKVAKTNDRNNRTLHRPLADSKEHSERATLPLKELKPMKTKVPLAKREGSVNKHGHTAAAVESEKHDDTETFNNKHIKVESTFEDPLRLKSEAIPKLSKIITDTSSTTTPRDKNSASDNPPLQVHSRNKPKGATFSPQGIATDHVLEPAFKKMSNRPSAPPPPPPRVDSVVILKDISPDRVLSL